MIIPAGIYASPKEITAGVYDNNPLVFMTESGPQGFFIDILEQIAEKEDWSISYRYGSWNEVYNLLINNEIDILPVVAFLESRLSQLDYSKETLISNWGQVYARKNLKIDSIQDLEGKKIAVMSNDTHGDFFKNLLTQLGISFEICNVENYNEIFESLQSGKCDTGVVNYIASKNYLKDFDLQSTPIVFNPIQIRYAVPKGDPADILSSIDKYIIAVKADKNSIFYILMAKWFGDGYRKDRQLPAWLKWAFGLIFLISIILFTWVVTLRFQVQLKTKEIIKELNNRKAAEQELKKSEALNRKMLTNIGDVIAIIDKDGINKYKSSNIEKLFGWKPEEVVGRKTWENIHPDDLQSTQNLFNMLLTEPDAVKSMECRYLCKDGSYKWIEFFVTSLLHDPDINGLLLNYHDITERKNAEEEKEKLQSQINQSRKMESVGRLAGGVAHDFNNMLGVIIGHVEMAMEQTDKTNNIYTDLKEIHNAASRSANLTKQLLTYARKQIITPKVLNLNESIEGMLKMLERLIGENIKLEWLPENHLWQIKMDSSQIDQILTNLCVNSRDAIKNTGNLIIKTENCIIDEAFCRTRTNFIPGEYLKLSVSDNGSGMNKDTLEILFEPFSTTKKIGEGTGLGLATVYGIVKQNNGFIDVYSTRGIGTTFTIYLPRHYGAAEKSNETNIKEINLRGTETILLVEDESSILNIVKSILDSLGYKVIAISSTADAVKIAEMHDNEIHLLISDVIMPGISGRELAEIISSYYPELKVLYMSGYTSDIITQKGMLDPGVNFIQKPFSIIDIGSKVRTILDS